MSDSARSVLLTLLLVVSTLSSMGVGAATATPTGDATTFHVTQGENCYEVSPVTSSEDTVEEFYNYRAGAGTKYGSYGEGSKAVQDNQVSHLFVYEGSKGLSLVMLHDELNSSQAGAISFDISGLPADHKWAVEDDDYPNQDDNFDHSGTSSSIDWMWDDGRTDGAAVRGLGGSFDAITIESAFGENSWAYQERDPKWEQATDNVDWKLRSGDGTEYDLTKGQSLTVEKGSCPDTSAPTASLSASPNTVANNEAVSFDAGGSSDGDSSIVQYKWDFDGDGTVDRTTSDTATVSHTYESADTYEASVTVVDEAGNEDTATATVTVESSDTSEPTVSVNAPETVNVGDSFDVSATASDESKVKSYEWTFGSTTETGSTVTHSYSEVGTHSVTLTWTDTDDQSHTKTVEIEAVKSDEGGDTSPTAALTASPETVTVSSTVTLDASGSSDDASVTKYKWDFDGDDKVERTTDNATVDHAYQSADTYEVTVTVVDESGQTDTASATVVVEQRDTDDDQGDTDEPPVAKLTAPEKGQMSLLYHLDASASTDDNEIVNRRWFVDGKHLHWRNNPTTSFKPFKEYDEPGRHNATVKVFDASGQTDTATVEFYIEKVTPTADVSASAQTVEVGEEVTFTASDPNQSFENLNEFYWRTGDRTSANETSEWTTSFDETGEHTAEIVLQTRAGVQNIIPVTITVTADDSSSGGDNTDDDNEGGFTDGDGDNTDTRSGGIGGANPGGNNNDDSSDDTETVSAPMRDADSRVGEVVVTASGSSADPAVDVTDSAPAGVTAPTVAEDGFAALSYLNVSGADQATFTISKARLQASDASADAVSLFRYDGDAWTLVETAQVNETADAYEFRANVSDGTYAVGIGEAVTSVADVSVDSQRVEPGQTVTVTAAIENTGHAAGTRDVELTVGGEVVATKTVSVEADGTTEVTFTRTFDESGVYSVGVGDASAEVVVKGIETQTTTEGGSDGQTATETTTSDSSSGIPGFGVGVSLVALLAAALLALRRQ